MRNEALTKRWFTDMTPEQRGLAITQGLNRHLGLLVDESLGANVTGYKQSILQDIHAAIADDRTMEYHGEGIMYGNSK